MKVKDLATGNLLNSVNPFVCEQWKKNPDRYREETSKKKPEPKE